MADGYWVEDFSEAEQARLAAYVSNLDRPVFTLRDLPQVTCAALFARYSRSPKSLRRLLLDEFLGEEGVSSGVATAGGADAAPAAIGDPSLHGETDPGRAGISEVLGGETAGVGGEGGFSRVAGAGQQRASDLFSRVLADYGDDSVAQLAGVHLACEQVTQPLAKAIEWGRLAGYLEQSTRYIPYTDRRDGHYRYRRDPEVLASRHGEAYTTAMDGLFDAYCGLLEPLREHLTATLPGDADDRARRLAIRALALDLARGLLPAGTVSNVGVFASPQSLEQMVLRLRAHSLPEARSYAELIAAELRAAIPDFVTRLDRPDRGGVWVDYLRESAAALAVEAEALLGSTAVEGAERVTLVRWDPDGENRILAAALYPHSDGTEAELLEAVRSLPADRRAALFRAAVGERRNRRHRPGRGFEHCEYTFEVVLDYGAFRDLQRHRMLTIQWQALTPRLGFDVPAQVEDAGLGGAWREAAARAEAAWEQIHPELPEPAGYLVTLAHRLRCLVRLNAREAMHLIELRTSPQGHPAYRRICQEMLRQVGEVAGHRLVAESMSFAGREDVHLPRYAAEARANSERAGFPAPAV